MAKILLDVMGGDHAPKAILQGAVKAFEELRYPLVLIGAPAVIEKHLKKHKLSAHVGSRIEIVSATETIDMADKIKAIRSKPNAPINVGNRLAAESYRDYKAGRGSPSAFVSAGHSGAMMASALLSMGRLREVDRPAISALLPTKIGKKVVCLDVGANVDCKPEHLRDFAIMGALSASCIHGGVARPKVGILANGEERSKGNDLTRKAMELLDGLSCFVGPDAIGDFVGNVEPKEMFSGEIDVVVMDGFVGNLILKNSEALASMILALLKQAAKSNLLSSLGFAMAYGALKSLKKKVDYREVGAAPLLGVQGYAFISHGRSDGTAIKNALLRAQEALDAKMIERLEKAFASLRTADGAAEAKEGNTP